MIFFNHIDLLLEFVDSVDTSDFIDSWTTGPDSIGADPPNTVLVIDDEGTQDIAVMELLNPTYDSTANTLEYDIILENATSISLPNEFG